jgi:hypothetical protein
MNEAMKVINRFRKEDHWTFAAMAVEATYRTAGPKAAMQHARRIAAAYRNVRAHRIESKTQALKRQAEREGVRYISRATREVPESDRMGLRYV